MAKLRHGSWVARFSYTDAKSKKHEYWQAGFATEEEAVAHELEVKAGIKLAREQAKTVRTKGYETLAEWADHWAKTTLKINTRPTGYPTQEGRIRLHIKPLIGHLLLTSIRKSHGEQFKIALKAKGLKPKTRNHCVGLAKQMLADAVDEELIERNPWLRLKLDEVIEEWDWYRPDEMCAFLDAAKEHRRKWYLEIALGCRAGLRAGEVAGLFVEDCDLKTGDISIRRDVVRGQVQTPKSRNGRRTIRVPGDLLAELKIRSKYALLRPAETYLDQRAGKHRGHPFCLNADGKIHRSLPKTLENPIRVAAQKAKVEKGQPKLRVLTHRDLRHTFASHCRLAGIPLEDIKDLLGHSTLQMTMRYAHITKDRFAEAAKALEGLRL